MKGFIPWLVLACLALGGCAGPRPRLVSQQLEAPRSPGGPYTLTLTVANAGGGEGRVEAVARLISAATSQTAAQRTAEIELRAHEVVRVTLGFEDLPAGEYRASVQLNYPP